MSTTNVSTTPALSQSPSPSPLPSGHHHTAIHTLISLYFIIRYKFGCAVGPFGTTDYWVIITRTIGYFLDVIDQNDGGGNDILKCCCLCSNFSSIFSFKVRNWHRTIKFLFVLFSVVTQFSGLVGKVACLNRCWSIVSISSFGNTRSHKSLGHCPFILLLSCVMACKPARTLDCPLPVCCVVLLNSFRWTKWLLKQPIRSCRCDCRCAGSVYIFSFSVFFRRFKDYSYYGFSS